nr:MAG TPA: hypothetical protein [Caudoviricetes sp.]
MQRPSQSRHLHTDRYRPESLMATPSDTARPA